MSAVISTPAVDWKNPDYTEAYRQRAERLQRLRAHPEMLPALKAYYRDHIADFIEHWMLTYDPRVAGSGRDAVMPFLLMPRQREMVEFILERWRKRESGLIEKSRDTGCSWTIIAIAVALCLFYRNVNIGLGSAKEDLLDRSGDPSTLFAKARFILEHLPIEFRPQWSSAHLRLTFPETQSAVVAEAGDQIGRGGRTSIFFLDESAHIGNPKMVDAALLANTDVRIDASSVSGMANSFAERRHSGRIPVFSYHWRHDLRKSEEWAARKRAETDPVVWNAEYELNYLASVPSVIISPEWVQAAIDAHKKLGIEPTGAKRGALDVADEGRDLNAFAACHGILVTHCESWSGKGGDLHETAERAFLLADRFELTSFVFDGDGLGAGVRASANQIAERRREKSQRRIWVESFRGSAAVMDPDRKAPGTDTLNKDRFLNRKAQAWFSLRDRFHNTYRAINGAKDVDFDKTISLSSEIPQLTKLCVELSMPQWKASSSGKLGVDKAPSGAASPNLADSLMMLTSYLGRLTPLEVWAKLAAD